MDTVDIVAVDLFPSQLYREAARAKIPRYRPAINLSLQPPLTRRVLATLAQLHPFTPLHNPHSSEILIAQLLLRYGSLGVVAPSSLTHKEDTQEEYAT